MIGRSRRNYGSYKTITCDITWNQFKEYIVNSDYDKIYKNWVNSGYEKKLTPSIDRLDPKKNYTLDNIRICSLHENLARRGVLQ